MLPMIDRRLDTMTFDLPRRTSLGVVMFALRANAVVFKGAVAIGMMSRGGEGVVVSFAIRSLSALRG